MTRGRPRLFDRDTALQRAMEIFWAKGFEATQLTDLTTAMGINPPSFYAAFGAKETLFREALERYVQTEGSRSMAALTRAPVREAIAAMLRASVDTALASPSAGGCLVSLGLLNSAAQHADLREHLRQLRRSTVDRIRQRLARGVAEAELSPGLDVDRLATYFATVMHGLSLQAQDGASREALMGVVETAMAALPGRQA